jgi:integrase
MARSGVLDQDTLEQAANAYFAELMLEVDQPRDFPPDDFDNALAFQIEQATDEISRRDGNLTAHSYTDGDRNAARAMLKPMGVDFDDLGQDGQLAALSHVVRAKRQQMRYLLHSLQTPASRFSPDDELFASRLSASGAKDAVAPATSIPKIIRPDLTLGSTATEYNAYLVRTERQGSTRDETGRVLRWLQEEIDPATPVSQITHDQMREFRNCLLELSKGAQGKKLPFRQRLALPGQENLRFVTRQRYWRFTTKFFGWLQAEYRIANPAKDLLFEGGRNELRQSPEPFSTEELKRFLRTPLFSGYQSRNRMMAEGDCLIRNGYWWSAVLMMFTGARAGDIAQLLPSDFRFDHGVPHLIFQPGMLPEGVPKRSKLGPRTLTVPLHPALLELGIRQFVEARAKRHGGKRLLFDIGLGGHRMSTGMTKFWSRYLHAFDLFRPRRATHVHRHTITALLRAAGVSNEDSGAVLGHSNKSVTAGYGGDQGLERKLATLQKLDHGFDVVQALGGPYDPKKHRY